MSERAFVGLGSNLGDRESLLRRAIESLCAHAGVDRLRASGLYESDPVGPVRDQPTFLNAVVELQTTLSPDALLELLLATESELGRVRTIALGPRTIDLDLLLFGDRVIDTPRLTLPHPRMAARRFVLEPLLELVPDLTCPRTGQPYRTALALAPPDRVIRHPGRGIPPQ